MEALQKFQSGDVEYLLTTDLLARGLDINSVKVVINFSFPVEPRRYVHRVGRTARAGASGVALTLCNDEERKEVKKLSRKLNFGVTTFSLNNRNVLKYQKMLTNIEEAVVNVQDLLFEEKEEARAFIEA